MRLGLIGLAFVVTACASSGGTGTGGFKSPAPDANFGPEPNVEADARAHFSATLKDPESAQYRIGYVGKAHCNKGTLWGGDVTWFGYAANVYVNAKNSYGAYTGYQPYTLLWRQDGTFGKQVTGADFGNATWAPGLCRWANGKLVMAAP